MKLISKATEAECKAALQAVLEILYYDSDGQDKTKIDLDKPWDSDVTVAISEQLQPFTPTAADVATCKFCRNDFLWPEGHTHQGQPVGPCCWDERLRATQTE